MVSIDRADVDRARKALRRELRGLLDDLIGLGWSPSNAWVANINSEVGIELDRGWTRMRILHDRGDPMIEVGSAQWAYSPTAWREYLSGVEQRTRLKLTDEIAMLRADLPAIEKAILDGSVVELQLRAIASTQLQRDPPWLAVK